MTKPLTPEETDDLLKPHPKGVGPDAYPTGQVLFGFPVWIDPDIDRGTVRMIDENGREQGRITDIGIDDSGSIP